MREMTDASSLLYYFHAPAALTEEVTCGPPIAGDEDMADDYSPYPIVLASAVLFKKEKRRAEEDDGISTSFHVPLFTRLCSTLPDSQLYYKKKPAIGSKLAAILTFSVTTNSLHCSAISCRTFLSAQRPV